MPIVTLYRSTSQREASIHPSIQHDARQPLIKANHSIQPTPTPSVASRPSESSTSPIQPAVHPNTSLTTNTLSPSTARRVAGCHLILQLVEPIDSRVNHPVGVSILSTKRHRPHECPTHARRGAPIRIQGPLYRSGGKETHQTHGPPTVSDGSLILEFRRFCTISGWMTDPSPRNCTEKQTRTPSTTPTDSITTLIAP